MSSVPRKALLVGSLPFENEEEAMREALDRVGGENLIALPDGEIGEKTPAYPRGKRAAWTQCIVDTWEHDTENWEVKSRGSRNADGFPIHYHRAPRLKPKHPPHEMDRHLNLHWIDYFQASYPVFKRLRAERNLPDLRFQVGLPTAMGVVPVIQNPRQVLRYAPAFTRRMAYEANRIIALADPGDIVLQIEVPPELAMAYFFPKWMVDLALVSILDLLWLLEPGVSIGMHLCMGDLNNRPLFRAPRLDKMVHFTNQLVKRWPRAHRLDYVHVPLAEAAKPPQIDPQWYRPLKDMRLPTGTRFVAGFLHEKRTDAENRQILDIIEKLRGEPVDIAASCGLGRRTRPVAENLLDLTRKLLTA